MNKLMKGAVAAIATTGIVVTMPNVANADIPAGNVAPIDSKCDNVENSDIVLLPNPIIRNEDNEEVVDAFELKNAAKKKISDLQHSREIRVRAEKKERLEAKRRKEIVACCGVMTESRDRQILERIVEAEAGGEDITGRVLVANVVLNRVKSKEFPSSIEEVVFAHSGSTYQFSPISDGRYYQVNVSEGTKKAVDMALHGDNPSEGALYFMERSYADSSNVSWFDSALTRLFKHGCHEFFK